MRHTNRQADLCNGRPLVVRRDQENQLVTHNPKPATKSRLASADQSLVAGLASKSRGCERLPSSLALTLRPDCFLKADVPADLAAGTGGVCQTPPRVLSAKSLFAGANALDYSLYVTLKYALNPSFAFGFVGFLQLFEFSVGSLRVVL